MWIKTDDYVLINMDFASAIWCCDGTDYLKAGSKTGECEVNTKLSTGDGNDIVTLGAFPTRSTAQRALELIGDALVDNRLMLDMKEVSKEE